MVYAQCMITSVVDCTCYKTLLLSYSQRLRNTGGFEARKLDTALQQASEKAISHLVKASAEIAKGMEIAKQYIRDRQELDAQSPRWSTLGGTPTTERTDKVHRVPPMMMGGQSIQPVVALSRTLLNTSNPSKHLFNSCNLRLVQIFEDTMQKPQV